MRENAGECRRMRENEGECGRLREIAGDCGRMRENSGECGECGIMREKQCRLDIRKNSFSKRTENEWSRLSADCVGASSVNMFKNKIDMCLRRAGYI